MSYEFLKLYDDINMAILGFDQDMTIGYFNSAFLTLFKFSPRHINKNPKVMELLPSLKTSWPELFDGLNKFSAMRVGAEKTAIHNESELTLIPRLNKIQNVFVLSFTDMSVEKKLYEKYREKLDELKASHEQIIQADKLKTIGEMSANISHEINNPLTVASGNAEIIEFTLDEEDINSQRETIKDAVLNIKESHERISHIITGMKEFLYKNEDRKEYCTVQELVERSIDLVKTKYEDSNIKIAVKYHDPEHIVLVNKIKLEQVIINLLQNALDALVDAKTINPKVDVIVSTSEGGTEVFFDVIDNGPGIPNENHEKIFQAFYTTKDVGKGTGLGLSISSRIILAHQGRLSIVPEKKGAHFRIELPCIEVSSFVDNTSQFLNHDNQDFVRVLVVDNEPNILNLCQRFFDGENFLLIGSTSGEAALKMLEQTRVDIIITDINMPGMSGHELAKRIHSSKKKCPVVYMSGDNVMETYKNDKDTLGIRGAIIKPFTRDVFINTIKDVLANK